MDPMPSTLCETLVTFSKMHLPYLALEIFAIGLIFALKCRRNDIAEMSQQVKQNPEHFLALSLVRCTVLLILAVFMVATLFPKLVSWWTAHYLRLMSLQGLLISAAIVAAVGAIQFALILLKTAKGAKSIKGCLNALFMLILAAHLFASVSMNFLYGWEIAWFTAIAVPYLGSVLSFEPNIDLLNNLPVLVQLYLVQGLLVFAIAPFFSVSWAIFNPKCPSRAKS
jgi:nitrate reductase gamma subunit